MPRINFSLVIGALLSLGLGLVVDYFLTDIILEEIGKPTLIANVAVVCLVAIPYFLWNIRSTPIGYRGVVTLFNRRIRRSGRGMPEGYNWLPLPEPVMGMEDVDCKQKQLDFPKAESLSGDRVVVTTDGFVQFWVADPYRFLSVENVIPSLAGVSLRAIRTVVNKGKAINREKPEESLPSLDKARLSEMVEAEMKIDIAEPDVQWGLGIGLLRINNLRLPPDLEAALRKLVQEHIEGDYEDTQSSRRATQVERLRKLGVSPDMALAGALVDAEKPGAEIKHISGIGDVGKGIKTIGEALGRVFTPK